MMEINNDQRRRVKVVSINNDDSFKVEITFEEKWFLISDTLVSQRTSNKYQIDALYRYGKRMDIIGEDEYAPYDININDLFYVK